MIKKKKKKESRARTEKPCNLVENTNGIEATQQALKS